MRASLFHRLVLPALVLAAGCPKGPATTSSKVSDAPDPQLTKLARVLRTADRRVVDADFRSLLSDPDPLVRARAAVALGQIGERAALPDVATLSADAAAEVRASAAFALGLIADGSSEADLERLGTDAEASVRAAAAEALGRLHDPHGTEV